MKRVLFLTILPFLLLGTASVNLNAQVTIGSEQKPQSGAVLDLSQVTNQDLGFLLPRVSLENVTDWQLRGNPNNGIGMLVYNINPNTTGGNGKSGVYMWTESGWEPLKSNLADAIQVENFDLELSGATLNLEPSGATLDLYIGQTVFFTAKNFMPSDATYPGVTWIITEGVDKTSIDNSTKTMTSCSVTGLAEGRSILSATSLDENFRRTVTINVNVCTLAPAVPTGIAFSKTKGIWLGEEITATATPEVTTGGSKPTKYNWTIPTNFDITAGSATRVITLKAKTAAESITGAIKVIEENDCGASADYSNTTALSIFDCSSIPDQPGTISGNINVTSGTIQT
ncbi:MAG: hypothetical protein LBC48_04255, partial [Dysgonamonadaceae bacterium]|nr:hypothetical protein [Dysgonamonadaceae bacterium]